MIIGAINSKAPSARNGSAPRRSRTYPIAQIGIGAAFLRRPISKVSHRPFATR